MVKLHNNTFSDKLYTYFATEAGITILSAIDFYRVYMLQNVKSSYSFDFSTIEGCCSERVCKTRASDGAEMDTFFSCMGNNLQEDHVYGSVIVSRALDDMETKINSPEILEFNIFEEYLFYKIAELLLRLERDKALRLPMEKFCKGNPCPFLPDVERETQIENHLIQEFSFSYSKAKRYAKLMCRMWEIANYVNPGTLFFFRNISYIRIFNRSFLKGLLYLKSPKGAACGYGIAYVAYMLVYDFGVELPSFLFSEMELPDGG